MRQYEAVIKVMEKNGGFATLGYLNQHVLKVEDVEWKTKTPFASIRRIVQTSGYFFKIRPGLWALNEYKNKLPKEIYYSGEIKKEEATLINHTYYQGLVIELGNLKGFETFAPDQDKNKKYLNAKLGDIRSVKELYKFGYDEFIKVARTIDASWFNNRKMPKYFFEVEHTTDIYNSLIKFVELQDFNAKFYIVADKARKNEFESKISKAAFSSINDKKRVEFIDYDALCDWHATMSARTVLDTRFK